MNVCTLLLAIVAVHVPLVSAECTDAGVIVVASVFATLAVVFIVLAIIGFWIWKRRKDILKPEKLKSDSPDDNERKNGSKFGYFNPAFDVENGDGDSSLDYKDGKNTFTNVQDRDLAKKTWSSLPPSDMPNVRQRKSSLGSLDKFMADSNTEEVWLTSQDFIGLGFNIAGSMRDGIFVSQVHNRGPAKESGKFQVGDRIMNVGISFENMVYEDALTILSYASPYPVRVTLQKQQTMPKNRKLSDVRTNLNHPLYRSQSVEVLGAHINETPFYPKRAASEMRYCPKNQAYSKERNASFNENIITEELGNGSIQLDNEVFEVTAPKTSVVVHSEITNKGVPDENTSVGANNITTNLGFDNSTSENKPFNSDDELPKQQFIDPFETLTEQDKLDMLRLSYTDPDAAIDVEKQQKSADASIDLRSVPLKPERKKKRSSTNSTPLHSDSEVQGSSPSSPVQNLNDDDNVFSSSLLPPSEAPPPIPEIDMEELSPSKANIAEVPPLITVHDNEAEENFILPETRARNIAIGSNSIEFHQRTETVEDISIKDDDSVEDSSEFKNQNRNKTDASIPDDDSSQVVEENFTATQIQKDKSVPLRSNIFAQNEKIDTLANASVTTTKNVSDDIPKSEADDDNTELPNHLHQEADTDKSFTELDGLLSLDKESVIFKESFPSKNAKEKENSYAYDISVTELEAMERTAIEEERKKQGSPNKKGGIAFEVRDDFVTGELRTVNHLNIHKTRSYDTSLSDDRNITRDISPQRPTSFKGNDKIRNENDDSFFEWSGKRLVRSGSFTEIPQGDTDKEWTDEKHLVEDDALIEKHIHEDSMSSSLKKLTKATFVTSNRTIENAEENEQLSDSDSQCRSLSSSFSSRDSPPPGESMGGMTNIKDSNNQGRDASPEGRDLSPDTSKHTNTPLINMNSDVQDGLSTGNDQTIIVKIHTMGDSEEEC
ncbi:uncharacterized protein LOC132737170 [Ruditapes philippinarum]|uniref:uncharacterized protein LOC132737170 n=1 Tax=Ruditapes philippinarum TaxID=129788 RepID=UPI00295B28D2|nr:uncharacterized protein LOC132737170 [Ruditapes philippinarum]